MIPIHKAGLSRVHIEPVEVRDGEIRVSSWSAFGEHAPAGASWSWDKSMPLHVFLDRFPGDIRGVWFNPDGPTVVIEQAEVFGRGQHVRQA